MQSRKTTWVLLLLGAAGCVGGDGADRAGNGYLMLEQGAREAGFELEGLEASPLPLAVEPGDEVVLLSPDGTRTPIRIGEDELVRVGARGAVARAVLGDDASRDRVEVHATAQAATALADELGAAIDEQQEGVYWIEAPDVIAESAGVRAPEGLGEVRWVASTRDTSRATPAREVVAGAARASLPVASRSRALDVTSVLPPSARKLDEHRWNVDAMLPAPVRCSDPIEGVWVSREHYDSYQDWYLYTVEIRRSQRDPSVLEGSMTSRSWNGDSARALPNSCDLFDWSVEMPVAGRIDRDGSVRFGGTSFRIGDSACGIPGDYRTDQFSGQLMTSGEGIKAFNNDGARAVNDPHTFRRIACR